MAAYSLGQAIASPLFGFWSNRINQTKLPMGAGMFIMFLSNLLYCFTESFPQKSRKWVLMAARFLCGLGAGTVFHGRYDRYGGVGLVPYCFRLSRLYGVVIWLYGVEPWYLTIYHGRVRKGTGPLTLNHIFRRSCIAKSLRSYSK